MVLVTELLYRVSLIYSAVFAADLGLLDQVEEADVLLVAERTVKALVTSH
ncbi:hypothetical protein [Roseivivax marinus]|nr:hypothetical protein [Roseivivax marinus]